MEMVMPEKKKATKPAAKKAKAPKAAPKKSDERMRWERRVYLYEKKQSGKALTKAEAEEADLIVRQRGDLVPGYEPA